MKRRFVIGVDGETPKDIAEFGAYVRQAGFGWFHWFENLWLLTSRDESVTTDSIRDELRRIVGDKHTVVLEVQGRTWSNYGPQGKGKGERNISSWFNQTWDTD